MLAYLMRSQRLPLDEAFYYTKRRRAIVFPNFGFWQQLMREEEALFGKSSPMPQSYQIFPAGILFRHYATAYLNSGHGSEARRTVVAEWPEGMGGGSSVEGVLLSSLEHLSGNARRAAVCFIKELLDVGRFTRGEVFEGFDQLLNNMDLEFLRIDIPMVEEYLVDLLSEAEWQGLIPPGSPFEVPGVRPRPAADAQEAAAPAREVCPVCRGTGLLFADTSLIRDDGCPLCDGESKEVVAGVGGHSGPTPGDLWHA